MLGLPATVTRPGFEGCLNCRWLPVVLTWRHPSLSNQLDDLSNLHERAEFYAQAPQNLTLGHRVTPVAESVVKEFGREVCAIGPRDRAQVRGDDEAAKVIHIPKRLEDRTAKLSAKIDLSRTAIFELEPHREIANVPSFDNVHHDYSNDADSTTPSRDQEPVAVGAPLRHDPRFAR